MCEELQRCNSVEGFLNVNGYDMKNIVEHEGVVTAMNEKTVTVQIKSVSACASCAAHAKCGFAESKDKTLEIPTQAIRQSGNQAISIGSPVVVCIDSGSGMKAVWIAYLLPAIIIIGVVIALSAAGVAEGLVALAAFGVLGLHILALFLLRKKIEQRFQITIKPC